MSNRIGRRPLILLGLLGNIVTSVMFGTAQSYSMAILARVLCGLVNGNIGVAKCVLGEICDDTNIATGFGMFSLLFGIGSLFGSALGGLLAAPVDKYPFMFGGSWLFTKYPYLLPCLFSSTVSLIGLVAGLMFLEETLPAKVGYSRLFFNSPTRMQRLSVPADTADDAATMLASESNIDVTLQFDALRSTAHGHDGDGVS